MENKRVKLIRMEDPYTKLKKGDEGTIVGKDSLGQILVKWDNGSTLSLIPEIDEYEIIEEKVFKFFEFVKNPDLEFINAKMEEIQDLVSGFKNVQFSWNFESQEEDGLEDENMRVEISIPKENVKIEWKIDMDRGELVEITNHGDDTDEYETKFTSPDEALGIVEKEIYYWLGVPEKKRN